jgi:hypothetical protein
VDYIYYNYKKMECDKIQNQTNNPLRLMSKLKSQREYDPMSKIVYVLAWKCAGD